MKPARLILSCEHGVNTVPPVYQDYFVDQEALLHSHRGIDFGSLAIASYLSQALNCELIQAKATRLLIDCNRSLSHPRCFSEISAPLPKAVKEEIIQQYYLPFRKAVEKSIANHISQGYQVLHLSIHSFTPVIDNLMRNADIGLLYDPARSTERILAKEWQSKLNHHCTLRVRMNYPYRGISDGFTSALRRQFSEHDYLGLEIENNQALVSDDNSLKYLSESLVMTLKSLLQEDLSP
ncbi:MULTISPECIES: N-formylglutamate amidohydrolase [unclassified Legionella]|uniref:N-formylglutamate amidohydrolase n=1 Tax=unclassified Legionella TaxID=2622702 RepID=UPI001054316B|nr:MULTISPECIES: N-formylglutamate amidohydrolase [unclassified Legionella]MDI9818740.1 N-formylglutamate amidohydrolase [Legionella sp. PL877]